ncbi:MAG: ABC transporter ATP-binding protein [Thermorudis peleae]|nr:ABC transporter ATP-binding protein [Thermorudis peleae]
MSTLTIHDLVAGYGESVVLKGISLMVNQGQIVGLLGRNGAGKTTTMRSILGLTTIYQGDIAWDGASIVGLTPHLIARRGIAIVPQGRRIFPSLSVEENLLVAMRSTNHGDRFPWTLERIYEIFPILRERRKIRGTLLSGGEQQMLAFARALATQPRLLLCDEPSEGLAPRIVAQVGEILQTLKRDGIAILLAEQNLELTLAVADMIAVIEDGQIVWRGTAAELEANQVVQTTYLGVAV